jgi:peroxiredoxin
MVYACLVALTNRFLVAVAASVCLAVVTTAGQQAQTPVEPTLKVGEAAPAFSLPGTDDKTHKLSDYKGKTVVLAWFPAAFTGG